MRREFFFITSGSQKVKHILKFQCQWRNSWIVSSQRNHLFRLHIVALEMMWVMSMVYWSQLMDFSVCLPCSNHHVFSSLFQRKITHLWHVQEMMLWLYFLWIMWLSMVMEAQMTRYLMIEKEDNLSLLFIWTNTG